MKQALAGIDIGGTKIAIALASTEGEILAKRRLPTQNQNGPFAVLESVSQTLTEMLRENEASLAAIGVGSPAPLDAQKGLILSPSNLLDWDRFPVVQILREKFGVPVLLDNDANAAALGEYSFGAGRSYNNVFYVTVSTGIGGGIVIDGEIYHGVSTGAGEIGHTIIQPDGVRCNCGSVGCLETLSSGTHIVRRVNERLATGEPSVIRELTSDDTEVSVQIVVEAVRRDDPLAIEIWNDTCRYLAIGIANAITLLAPEVVVVGGGIASAGYLLFEPLKKLVPEYVSMIPKGKINIVPAALGTESGLYGSVELAKKAYSGSLASYAS